MATTYTKPHLTLSEQMDLLSSRNLHIPDRQRAERWLRDVGYYRLSAYWYPYRVSRLGQPGRRDHVIDGTTFDQVVGLYEFDRRLKLLVFEAVERVEIAVRSRVGHVLGRHDPYAHLNRASLDGRFTQGDPSRYDIWLKRVLSEQRRSREDFVEHFRTKYNDRLPVWVVTEILDFGALSVLYGGMQRADRDEIAAGLGLLDRQGRGDGRVLVNWMRVLNYVRNVCAHHSRLWNRNLADQIAPRGLSAIDQVAHLASSEPAVLARVFSVLCVISYLLGQTSTTGNHWTSDVDKLISEYLVPTGRDRAEMGFPAGWRDLPLWSTDIRNSTRQP
ncbi:MAG: Abi family protein [Dermatophilaceae bacterium]